MNCCLRTTSALSSPKGAPPTPNKALCKHVVYALDVAMANAPYSHHGKSGPQKRTETTDYDDDDDDDDDDDRKRWRVDDAK